ncbi:vesicle transport v-snare protein vti1 [Fomitiporia mediterranea MF3/22]|uniref:vesicle transport v-snare protein vti1 n=1 Tax=Fomitiporia mediterranea (strain MF3/22) TaxID=694068 RepID=UPI0004408DB8|nr:vesicle transport v-snare protein vti1 [Fomitiporia mediterranea MF3/22]EJD04617.1 vesicle transport v-snare protein vti1 [Fomitiporia mediterranea MF3/22]
MDNSPTSLFDTYEADFDQIVASIRTKLDGDSPEQSGEQRKAALRRVEMELDEADEMVAQMEIELQGMPQSIKQPYANRRNTAKSTLSSLKTRARTLHATVQRAALLSSTSDAAGSPFRDSTDELPGGGISSDRTRLLKGTQLLEGGSQRLQDAHRVALETEDQGADILRDLRRQREQIENSRNTLQTADSAIDRASGTLKRMIRRMYQQRAVTAAIIIVLIVLIVVILWFKLS